ncbi:MAG: hypothetical protein WEB13_00090 [Dehalococcoidia bacterium]
MSWLDRLRGKKKAAEAPAHTAAQCPHVTLVPRWDAAGDMGHEDRATSYRCDACLSTFTPEEARELRRTEAERITHDRPQ